MRSCCRTLYMSDLPFRSNIAPPNRDDAIVASCGVVGGMQHAGDRARYRGSPNGDAAIHENDKLLMILSQYKRMIFGPCSEKLDIGQLSLFAIRAQAARGAANDDVTGARLPDGAEGRAKRPARRNRASFRSIYRASMS